MLDSTLKQYFIALLATGIFNGGLGIFVLLKGFNKRLNQLFALYSFSLFLWSIFEALGITRYDKSLALALWRINHIGVVFIPIFLVHFIFLLINIKGWKRKLIPVSYILGSLFVILDATPLLILEVVPKFSFRYFINPGKLYYAFFWMWIAWAVYGNIELFKEYLRASGHRKNQMKYFYFPLLFSYIGGVPNFFPTFNIEIPVLMPYGTYAITLYTLATAYAIVKYNLMDINLALTRAGIFVVVYALVLGIPFFLGYEYGRWLAATWVMFFLAGTGQIVYQYLRKKAEEAMLREQHRYQRALRELSREMARIRDLGQLLKSIVLTVADVVRVDYIAFYLKDELHKSYGCKYRHPEDSESKLAGFIPFDAPIVKLLSANKRPLLGEELQHLLKSGPNCSLIVPCFVEDELLGIMMLGSKPQNRMYTPDDMLVFETLSYSTALAIENCNFWKEIEDRQRVARLQEMDTYSYSLAHEIDNPIYTIIGQAETLENTLLKELNLSPKKEREIKGSLSYILDSAWRVSAMVEAIRDFGRPVTGELKPLRINDVIESFNQLYFPRFKSAGITFIKEIPEGLGFVRGEKPQLMQVLVILANNSLHAMQRSKEKTIILKAETVNHKWARISFRDTGCGVKKEDLGIIFQPFVTTKASSEGSGMGLYNAKKIIERHKGMLWAESEGDGKGAVFFIDLPRTTEITPEEQDNIDNEINLFKK